MRCYICSWLFDTLSGDDQRKLGLVAEGKMSEDMIAQGTRCTDPRAKLLNHIRKNIVGGRWNEDVLWDSFTGMRIETYTRNSLSISVRLNPLHEGYFPLTTKLYDCWLSNLWITMTTRMCSDHDLKIITQQGMFVLALAPM